MKPCLSLDYLMKNKMSKKELSEKIGIDHLSFDYALPQNWLNRFVAITKLDYNLVLSTTFWVYEIGSVFGKPISGCCEVQNKIDTYR
jgi:hypothetical protein